MLVRYTKLCSMAKKNDLKVTVNHFFILHKMYIYKDNVEF